MSHNLTNDDGMAFRALLEPVKRQMNWDKPPILFAYNYFHMAEQLRAQGLRAYSVTIALSGGHLRALLADLPFKAGTFGAVVLLQKSTYRELFEAIEVIALKGIFVIEDKNIPFMGEIILQGMGFNKALMRWHEFSIWRRHTRKERQDGQGFEVFNAKQVQSKYQFHRAMLGSA